MKRDVQIPEGHLSSEDACKYLNISHNTLDRRVDDGLITPVKLKGDTVKWQPLYYRIEDLDRLKRGGSDSTDGQAS